VSWLYTAYELVVGKLPWHSIVDKDKIMDMKIASNIGVDFEKVSPEMCKICGIVEGLGFKDRPNYEAIYNLLIKAMERHGISMVDEFDWCRILRQKERRTIRGFVALRDKKAIVDVAPVLLPTTDLTKLTFPHATEFVPSSQVAEVGESYCCTCW
jgi:hypothetical protein